MSQICGLGVVWIALKSVRLFSKAVIELLGRLKIPILESQNLMALKKNAPCNTKKETLWKERRASATSGLLLDDNEKGK